MSYLLFHKRSHIVIYMNNFSGALAQDNLECFVAGACDDSFHLDAAYVEDEIQCLELCKANEMCNWFSYYPQLAFCQLLHNCSELNVPKCPDCLSGQVDCSAPEPQCWVQGQCRGNMIILEETGTREECLELCKQEEGCKWFTYYGRTRVGQSCVLFRDCPELQEDCEACVSGERRCKTGGLFVIKNINKNFEVKLLAWQNLLADAMAEEH